MDKRLELLKLIINSDDEGIKAIWNSFYGKKKVPFTKEDLDEACKSVCSEMVANIPGRMLLLDDYVEFAVRIEKLLFKEEK